MASMASPPPVPSPPPPPAPPPPPPPNKPASPQWDPGLDTIPDDVALGVASFLGAADLCSLGSCSRSLRRLCEFDSLWASLCIKRWPSLDAPSRPSPGGEADSSPSSSAARAPTFPFPPPAQEWKNFYVRCHQEMAGRVSNVIKSVEHYSQNESLEVGHYLKAVADLHSFALGFIDTKLFLLTVKRHVFLNLVGLHYVIFFLRVPGIDVMEALQSSQISERQVCVNWFRLGRWFYGFRLPDESRSRRVSLWELATSEEELRNILNRGAIHEVLRVQITSVISTPSIFQIM
uniref:F-box domain-containing protein n=1 Tax=Anthurium amnicola TaxID=1678845 RepID=A0A1D1YIS3_9ARAE